MKKYILFLFVFVLLIGSFTPFIRLQAVMLEDIEYREQEEKVEETITIDLSEEECVLPQVKKDGVCTTPANPVVVSPATKAGGETEGDYVLLEPLPCPDGAQGCEAGKSLTKFDTTGTGKLGVYLNWVINLFIGLCAVAAVVMLVIAGIEYSSSELISTKAAAIERIKGAIFGLVLALTSWTLLYTINPDLLNSDVEMGGVTLGVVDEEFNVTIGPGTIVNDKVVKIQAGGTTACKGGLISTGSDVPFASIGTKICSDLLAELKIIYGTYKNFRISSRGTVRGSGRSNCHYMNGTNVTKTWKGGSQSGVTITENGNCADIVVTNVATWDSLCIAMASRPGILNFVNETESTKHKKCEEIQPYRYQGGTGPHLHVKYIGGGGSTNNNGTVITPTVIIVPQP